jgi:hypothetical protein
LLCHVVGNALELLVSYRHCPTRAVANRPSADSSEQIFLFMEKQGSTSGARRDVIDRAKAAMNEFVKAVSLLELSTGDIHG